MNYGIDYGMGTTNVDAETGIRYGVINMNTLRPETWEDFESDYGPPTCGRCGNPLAEFDEGRHGAYAETRGCCDFACETCEKIVDSDEAFPDEPHGHFLDDGTYKATVDSDNDVFVLCSPYYTHAQFCSPCAPGACYLANPTDKGGPRAYCLGHDWFEGDKAPYLVYDVKTGQLVQPETRK